MIRGYVSSDEDDYDDYDFGYSEPLIIERKGPCLPEVQISENREKLYSAVEECKAINAFFNAVNRGDISTLQELLSKGTSVNCIDSEGWTPLMRACGTGEFEVVQFLLENGADVNKHRELLTSLMICCTPTLVEEELKLNCVRLLLQHGAEINAKDKFQTTALMYAAGGSYAEIVTELLAIPGVDVNIQDRDGWTALFHAVKNNDVDLAERLMAAGTDLDLKDRYGRTVVNLALDKNFKKLAIVLGYVEEDEEEEEEVAIYRLKDEPRDRFLKELPDQNGSGGFSSDAQKILQAFNQYSVKDISLPDLLNATDEDLYEVGVKLKPDRHKILLKGIHRYHLHPWKNSSLHQIKPGVQMSLEDVIAITGTLAKHLTIANASLRYLNSRISSRSDKKPPDLSVEKEMIISLIDSYNSARTMKTILPKILKHLEQIKPEIPADFIYPYKKENMGKKFAKPVWYLVGATVAGFLIFSKPSSLYTLLTLIFKEIPPILESSEPFFDCDLI